MLPRHHEVRDGWRHSQSLRAAARRPLAVARMRLGQGRAKIDLAALQTAGHDHMGGELGEMRPQSRGQGGGFAARELPQRLRFKKDMSI